LTGTVRDTIRVGLVLVTLVLAVLVGWALGGRLSYLEQLPYRSLPLLGGALVALLGGTALALADLPARLTQGVGLALAAGLTLTFCLRSRAVAGLGLVSAGLLLNALVILANAGMPVSADAARRAGVDPQAAVDDSRHLPAGADTALRPLADVIPVPLPVRPEVVSIGDLLGAAGMAQLVATAMLLARTGSPSGGPAGTPLPYRRRRPTPPPAHEPAGTEPPKPPVPARTQPAGPGHVLIAERRGSMTVWRAAARAASGPPAPRLPNGDDGGHVKLIPPRTVIEADPLPRAGPT
jgi:Family of unknown function (DUF5317)